MTYIIVVITEARPDESQPPKVEFYGPFPSERRANKYCLTILEGNPRAKTKVQKLTVPFAVVKNIIYR